MPSSRKVITADIVRERLVYSPDTGEFHFRSGRYAGRRAGSYSDIGYWRIFVDGRTYYAHRLAWIYMFGEAPFEIDHINRDRADNRICNLREATALQNIANKGVMSAHGYKGVSISRRKNREPGWSAYIRINGRSKRLGTFDRIEDAAAAYASAAAKLYGEFACC